MGDAIDFMRDQLGYDGLTICSPSEQQGVIDEYDAACADAGRLIAENAGLRAERDESRRLLAEAVDARDEAMREAETLKRERDETRRERQLIAERDAARREADAMRKVVEAAVAWYRHGPLNDRWLAIRVADYLAAKEKTP